MDKRFVRSTALNLRSAPVVTNTNRVAVLPAGHEVTVLESVAAPWLRVRTHLHGTAVEGFVHGHFLSADAPAVQAQADLAVHLAPRGQRHLAARWAFPLAESDAPVRTGADPVNELNRIIDWLAVDDPTHLRYKPGKHTYCNVYAYDYAYLCKVFLPRVWWSSDALAALRNGIAQKPAPGSTVNELNANTLFNWFQEFGQSFGWQRSFDLTQAQIAANQGKVVMLIAHHVNSNLSGHIAAIAPETANAVAVRHQGQVTRPVTSQAGRNNHKRITPASAWWSDQTRHRDHMLWIHD